MSNNDALRKIAGEIEKKETINRSLETAKRRQRMMLPKSLPELDGYQLGTVYRPADETSGDYYDVLTLEGSVAARDHIGGTAPNQVRAAVARAKENLAQR